jgi:hypothetical protein
LEIGVSQIICLGWPQTLILSISASQLVRITGVGHWHRLTLFSFQIYIPHLRENIQYVSESDLFQLWWWFPVPSTFWQMTFLNPCFLLLCYADTCLSTFENTLTLSTNWELLRALECCCIYKSSIYKLITGNVLYSSKQFKSVIENSTISNRKKLFCLLT